MTAGTADVADEDRIFLAVSCIQQVAAVGAEDEGADRRHLRLFGEKRQDGATASVEADYHSVSAGSAVV